MLPHSTEAKVARCSSPSPFSIPGSATGWRRAGLVMQMLFWDMQSQWCVRTLGMTGAYSHHDIGDRSSGSCPLFNPGLHSLSLILRTPNIIPVSLFLSLKMSSVWLWPITKSLADAEMLFFEYKDEKPTPTISDKQRVYCRKAVSTMGNGDA